MKYIALFVLVIVVSALLLNIANLKCSTKDNKFKVFINCVLIVLVFIFCFLLFDQNQVYKVDLKIGNKVNKSIENMSNSYTIIEEEKQNRVGENPKENSVSRIYKVLLKNDFNRDSLVKYSNDIIAKNPNSKSVIILYYLPNSDIYGVYSAARAIWAPNGKWINKESNDTMQLAIDIKREANSNIALGNNKQTTKFVLNGNKNKIYSIVDTRNVDYTDLETKRIIRRIEIKVQLHFPTTHEDLRQIAEKIIDSNKGFDAFNILFYLSDTSLSGNYTAGRAVWAPNGKWDDSSKDSPFKLSVRQGRLDDPDNNDLTESPVKNNRYINKSHPIIMKNTKSTLTTSTKKKIFYKLVSCQDEGMNDYKAYYYVAKLYGISKEVVADIAVEGIQSNWPMP